VAPEAVTEPLFQLAADRLRAMAFVGLQVPPVPCFMHHASCITRYSSSERTPN
jgi:hypothetical protein